MIRPLFTAALALSTVACAASSPPMPAVSVPSVATAVPACGGPWTGPGARPVSPTAVANWYIKDGRLVYAVFVRGEAGWYDRRTRWNQGIDSSGRFAQDLDVGGFKYSLIYDESRAELFVSGKAVDVRRSNIVFADKLGDSLHVRGGDQQTLCWEAPPDVPAEVFERSSEARAFVSGPPVPN